MPPLVDSFVKLVVPVVGAAIAMVVWLWNRHEARRKALTEIIRAYVRLHYHLDRCNTARRKRELLIRGFNEKGAEEKAVHYAEALAKDYSVHLEKAAEWHATLECESITNRFRFNPTVCRLIGYLGCLATRLGDSVNRGAFHEFDIHRVQAKELLETLHSVARGWLTPGGAKRLLAAIDAAEKRKKSPGGGWLSEAEMDVVFQLLFSRIETHRDSGFAVYAPRRLLYHRDLIERPDVVDQLINEPFAIAFPDGDIKRITLAQLCVLVHQLIVLQAEMPAIVRDVEGIKAETVKIQVNTQIDLAAIMQPAMVKVLLSKVEFYPQAAEEMLHM